MRKAALDRRLVAALGYQTALFPELNLPSRSSQQAKRSAKFSSQWCSPLMFLRK
jgi:hypothetical protein